MEVAKREALITSSVQTDRGILLAAPELPVQALVSQRLQELDLRPVEVVRACGYRNMPKGLRRLENLLRGSFKGTEGLVAALPDALELPAEVIQQAVQR